MKLSPRLEAIAMMMKRHPVQSMADIGTDHGYLPIFLVETNIVHSAIASDLNPGPLESARLAVEEANLMDKVTLRLGSGLETIGQREVEGAVIAGMGGVLIASLMGVSAPIARDLDYLILQPMQAQSELREWLQKNHYHIVEAQVLREGDKFYEIMRVKSGQMAELDWSEIHLGYNVEPSKDYIAFLEYRIKVQEQVMEGLKTGKRWDQLVKAHNILARMQERLQQVKEQVNES